MQLRKVTDVSWYIKKGPKDPSRIHKSRPIEVPNNKVFDVVSKFKIFESGKFDIDNDSLLPNKTLVDLYYDMLNHWDAQIRLLDKRYLGDFLSEFELLIGS